MWSPHNWATMNKSHGLLSFNSIDAGKGRKAFQDEKDARKRNPLSWTGVYYSSICMEIIKAPKFRHGLGMS